MTSFIFVVMVILGVVMVLSSAAMVIAERVHSMRIRFKEMKSEVKTK